MAGSAIDSVNQGVAMLLNELKTNPQALETAFLSIIAFSRDARQLFPLTELLQVQPPRFNIQPGTALGAALRLLTTCLKKDVVKTTSTTKGDYRPLVFLMTDGQPTDAWEDAADAIRNMRDPKIANFYAIGCGDDVDTEMLYRVTDVVLNMPDMSPDAFKKFFVWLTASVNSASVSVAEGKGDTPGNAINLPDGVLTVAPRGVRRSGDRPRQVFLRVRCSKTKKPYLMRFVTAPDGVHYTAKAAHPLEDASQGGGGDLPPVDSSLLMGCPPCPYCGNPRAGMCPCGTLFCNSGKPDGPLICPQCNAQLTAGGGGGFAVRQSTG
jgi:uncharacterized protein YegL